MSLRCNCCAHDGRMSVAQTLPIEGEIWRARVCPDCGETTPTVERVQPGWPLGIWTARAKARSAAKARDKVTDQFLEDAGADLAGLMHAFARPNVTA